MPVLKSPEVITFDYSGITCFMQEVRKEAPNEFQSDADTDVGINDVTGLNVICHKIELDNVCPANAMENSLRMTIHLCEAWAQKDEMLHDLLRKHHVNAHAVSNPYCEASTISVNGFKNIAKFTSALRSSFVATEHEGASIHRSIANAALLNAVLDGAVKMIAEDNEKRKLVDPRKFYISADWSAFNY